MQTQYNDGEATFTNLVLYKTDGNIQYYTATISFKGHVQHNASVAIQNNKVISWET